MSEPISRSDLQQLLVAWIDSDVDELHVWQQAQAAKSDRTPQDALVRDIIDTLASLPYDLITTDDALVMIDALANPASELDLSINLLWNHLDGIAEYERQQQLADHPFYREFIAQ